jgi:hypothetical protein
MQSKKYLGIIIKYWNNFKTEWFFGGLNKATLSNAYLWIIDGLDGGWVM